MGLWLAPSAFAAAQDIASPGPLTDIWIGDNLTCQVVHSGLRDPSGAPVGNFYGGQTTSPASCGTALSLEGSAPGAGPYGVGGLAPVSQTPVNGSGTPTAPYFVTTVASAGSSGVTVTERDSYVVGQESYRTDITVTNGSSTTWSGKVYHAGDCFLAGSDTGYGAVDTTHGDVACTTNPNNSPAGPLLEFAPITFDNHYFEGDFTSGFSPISSQSDYDNTCQCTTNPDNGMAINWDFGNLAPGSSVTFSMLTNVSASGTFVISGRAAQFSAPSQVTTGPATPTSPTRALLRGSANTGGSPTNAHWIYGLDASERGPGWGGNVFDQSTPSQFLGSDFNNHSTSFTATGLMPNSLYHAEFVASNSRGTTTGQDVTFRTPVAPVSATPPLGSENFTPHGTVFVLVGGKFVKLTQTMQLPSGTEVDALHGSLSLVANSGAGGGKASDARAKKPKKFTGTFSGAVFKVIQKKFGRDRGLTTIQLVDRTPAFRGAPSYATTCAHGSADAGAARLSRRVIYTLRSRSRGSWRSSGRSAAGTVGGTVWTTTDRCDGTLITAQVDNVLVTDLIRHINILLHPHQHYLARLKH